MRIGNSRRWVGTLTASALVLSGVSLAAIGPAGATTLAAPAVTAAVPAAVRVTEIRPDETLYRGWHNGALVAGGFTLGWNGVTLGIGDLKTQVLNGLVDSGAPGFSTTAAELGALITGSSIAIGSGSVWAQVPFTVDGGWGTLRPATPASSFALTDPWMSSKTVAGTTVVADTPMPLGDLLAELEAKGGLAYSGFGFYAQTPSRVTAMTWDGETFAFGPAIGTIPVTETEFVPASAVRPDESTYEGWHEGYVRTTPAFSVEPDGLNLGLGQPSQILNGLVAKGAPGLPVTAEELATLITSSTITVASGAVHAQVAYSTATGWGTLRPAAATGTSTPVLTDLWVSSKAIGSLPAETALPLVDLVSLLGDQGGIRYSGFGVLAMSPAVVTSIAWDGVAHSFVSAPTTTVLTGPASTSVVGTPVTYTATVSTDAVGGVTDGMVQFAVAGTPFASPVALVGGTAVFSWTPSAAGTFTVTAAFLGTATHRPSTATSAVHTVTVAPTTVALSAPAQADPGSDVVVTATVASTVGTPTGTVEFTVDSGAATAVPLVDGVASIIVADVETGTLTVAATYTGDSTRARSSNEVTVTVAFPDASGTADEKFIQRVYRDLFGRNADPAGLKAWTTLLATGTPRSAVANGITYSNEYRTSLITDIYARNLGRTPDTAGLASWLAAMQNGATVAQIESGFYGSDEYYAASGGTDAALVAQMYADILGRGAAASEIDSWVGQLKAGKSRQQVAMGFLLSTEHLTTVVNGYYQLLLDRDIDAAGKAGWVMILQAGGRDEAIIAGIVASNEYYTQP